MGDKMRVNSLGALLPKTEAPIAGGVAGTPQGRGGTAPLTGTGGITGGAVG